MKIESTTPQHSPTLENLSIKELEGLSHEQLAQGLCQLNMRTGSQEIVNAKDIPVILDKARSLASRSQVLQQAFDCQDVTLPFLQSLSQRFGTSVWDMAAEYDNAASREILWTWIQENGDLEAYNNIKMIRQIARECIQEANLAGIDFQPFLEDCSSAPNSCYWQTKGGLQLLLDGGCPCKLATPFGMVWLYRGGCYSSLAACSVAERIISRLGATLIDYPPTDDERPAKCVYVVLHRPNPHGLRALDESEMLKIPRSEGKSLIGKHDIVLSNEAGTLSEYEVKSIDGTNVRTLETYDRTDQRRSYGLINKIWQMLENNNQRIAPTPTTTPIEQVSNTPESSDSKPPRFGSLSEAAHWSADCVERLLLEPSKKSDQLSKLARRKHTLPLSCYGEGRLVELMIDARPVLPRRTYLVAKPADAGQGTPKITIDYLWQNHGNGHGIDLVNLRNSFQELVKDLGQNWKEAELKDFPHILLTESEETHQLFVKRSGGADDDTLIRFLLSLCRPHSDIHCHADYRRGASEEEKQHTYLWIPKSHLEEDKQFLGMIPKETTTVLETPKKSSGFLGKVFKRH